MERTQVKFKHEDGRVCLLRPDHVDRGGSWEPIRLEPGFVHGGLGIIACGREHIADSGPAPGEAQAAIVPIDADTILLRVHPEGARQGIYVRESLLEAAFKAGVEYGYGAGGDPDFAEWRASVR